MALDTAQVTVAGTGRFYAAPVGTTAPANSTAAWGGGWVDLGYNTEDGATFTRTQDVNEIMAWQSFDPIDIRPNTRGFSVACVLMQWNDDNIKFAFGGGTITDLTGGQFKWAPPAASFVDYRALGVEIVDGDYQTRWIIPKGMVSENVETQYTRSAPAQLPISFRTIATGSGDPYYFLSNDPAYTP